MRRLVLHAFLSVLCAAAPAAGAEISIDWTSPKQTITGFGGTMGWVHPSDKNFEKIADLLFKDLGASVLRIRALGAETGDEGCPEPVNDDRDATHINWHGFLFRDTEKRNARIIKAAAARGVRTIIATAWSPPGWMKDNGSRLGGGFEARYASELAELWTAYVTAMQLSWNIKIPYVSIQNEPDLPYVEYPTCSYSAKTYALAAEITQSRLREAGFKTQVVGPDVCRIYHLEEYKLPLAASGYRGPMLVHLYDLSIPYQDVHRDASRWREARKTAGEHPLWFMETANYLSGNVVKPGSYDEAFVWAEKIHHALVEGNCETVLYWSLYFDKPGETLIYAAKSDSPDYTITPKYYTSMHYFKPVRPGMVRVPVNGAPDGVLVSAFRTPDDAGRVVVAVNKNAAPVDMRFPADGFTWKCYMTDEKAYVKPFIPPETSAVCVVPARGITTWVGSQRVK